jgi:hypothetical protein
MGIMRIDDFRALSIAAALAGIVGCLGGQGATDGGSAENPDFRNGVFVGDETTSGSIDLQVEQSSLPVGSTTGFRVFAVDAQGQPVPSINVVCDSEKGIAIIEPNTGYELTGSSGVMSGVIGCEAPGSFQMVCRLNIGANRRKFASVRCTGDIPSGFTGFPGAAGGGLGGGTQTNDDGDVQILEAGFVDDGKIGDDVPANVSIDTVQNPNCDGDASTSDPEPFHDTYAVIKVRNNLAERVTLLQLNCSVTGIDGTTNTADCGDISLTRQADAALDGNGSTTTISVPMFKAYNGGKFVGNPTDGSGTQITATGLYTVSFEIFYLKASDDASGVSFGDNDRILTAQATASFGNFGNCP